MKKFNWLNIKKYSKKQKILISIIIIIFILVILWFLNKPVYTVNDLNPDDFTIILEKKQFQCGYSYYSISANGEAMYNNDIPYNSIFYIYKVPKNEIKELQKIIMSPEFWKTKKIYIGKFHILFMEHYLNLKIISNNKTIKSIKFIWFYDMPSIVRELVDRIKEINHKYCFIKKEDLK